MIQRATRAVEIGESTRDPEYSCRRKPDQDVKCAFPFDGAAVGRGKSKKAMPDYLDRDVGAREEQRIVTECMRDCHRHQEAKEHEYDQQNTDRDV